MASFITEDEALEAMPVVNEQRIQAWQTEQNQIASSEIVTPRQAEVMNHFGADEAEQNELADDTTPKCSPSAHWHPVTSSRSIALTPAELKTIRLRLGFRSRRALAEVLGVPKQTLDSWESGRRPIPPWLPNFLDCLEQWKITISTFQLFEMFPNQESARKYLESKLWPDGVKCPVCGNGDRVTAKKQGFYRCNPCKEDFTVRTGTIFERSHIPLHKWLYAMYLLVTTRKGISSLQLCKEIGITQKSAWFMLHRLREACGDDLAELRGIGWFLKSPKRSLNLA
jgi:transposase-like protein/DNA-binding transcriptional regulator YiaG